MTAMNVLVLGGYGNFGTRICKALAGHPQIHLLIAGRNASKAQVLADTVGHHTQALALDHEAPDLAQQLRALDIGLVIHTAGPFQAQDYGVAQAAAQAGCHYIDLADGRRFVCDFPAAMHGAFSSAGRTAVTGASTVPALSSAVVDALCSGWRREGEGGGSGQGGGEEGAQFHGVSLL